jgi:mannose-6-phosphate isomerase-like protein (cupin superfamily)
LPTEFPYITILETKYQPLEVIEEKQTAAAAPRPWYNETLCNVNDSVVRLGVVHGNYHWHHHQNEDEFFYVVEGVLVIETEDGAVRLEPGQGVTIPRGKMHFPRAQGSVVVLMVEKASVVPTGS